MRDMPSREQALTPSRAALLVIDVQNYCASPWGGEFAGRDLAPYRYFFDQLDRVVVPNIAKLQTAFRAWPGEVVFTRIESLTRDGRDRSLDYKISGLHVAKGAPDADIVEAIRPADDEIVLPKTASSVFNATNIDYVLRNLGIEELVVTGVVTDQCVESAVRDAADRSYLVTLVRDACCTYSAERHENALAAVKGYCRIRSTAEVVAEIEATATAAD